MKPRLTLEEFVRRAEGVHGCRYDYSQTVYVNAHTKVEIGCERHGQFLASPNNHVRGSGCPKCADRSVGLLSRGSTEHFIEKATEVHGDRYDYSRVVYRTTDHADKVEIVCPDHGPFWQSVQLHYIGRGCPECGRQAASFFGNRGVYKTEFPSCLYVMSVEDEGEAYIKVGVSSDPERRLRELNYNTPRGVSFGLILHVAAAGIEVAKLERDVLYRTVGVEKFTPSLTFAGCSECVSVGSLPTIIDRILSQEYDDIVLNTEGVIWVSNL